MYSRSEFLSKTKSVLDKIENSDPVSWTSTIFTKLMRFWFVAFKSIWIWFVAVNAMCEINMLCDIKFCLYGLSVEMLLDYFFESLDTKCQLADLK